MIAGEPRLKYTTSLHLFHLVVKLLAVTSDIMSIVPAVLFHSKVGDCEAYDERFCGIFTRCLILQC